MNDQKKWKKPVDVEDLFQGRFIKANELLGKKVTLKIKDVDLEGLSGTDGVEKVKGILSFEETEKKMVLNRTNALAIRGMHGRKLSEWVGKRITIFEDQFDGQPCIRLWGSPDIPNDIQVDIVLPRRRPYKVTMHRTAKSGDNGAAKSKTAEYLGAITGQPPADAPEHAEFVRELERGQA